MLSHLQSLQNLTCLKLHDSSDANDGGNLLAAAYATLTASSQLQHLDIPNSRLPVGVWQHVFPVGRQLSQLTCLNINWIDHPSSDAAAAPEGSLLVGCCPALQCLSMRTLQYSTEYLTQLQGLTALHSLSVSANLAFAATVGADRQATGQQPVPRELEVVPQCQTRTP